MLTLIEVFKNTPHRQEGCNGLRANNCESPKKFRKALGFLEVWPAMEACAATECWRQLHFICPAMTFDCQGKTSIEKQRHGPNYGGEGSDPKSWQWWSCKKLPIYLMCCVHFLTTNLTSSQMSSFARGFHFLWGVDSFRKLSSLITSLSLLHKMQPNLMSPFLI